MSKKKSFSGSTMTLKDFHGGSIQSDLSLPSAPGVSARQPDRFGFDRSIGSSFVAGHDQYRLSRPGSAGAVRGGGGTRGFIDENAPFLPHSLRIGRNFEEDERKPFDAASTHRRIPSSLDNDRRPRSGIDQTHHQRQQNHMMFGRPDSTTGSAPNFMSEGPHFPAAGLVVSSHNSTAYGNGGVSAKPNAWAVRKEAVSEPQVPQTSMLSGTNTASRFAHASAIEKISSGRWQSKHEVFSQTPNSETLRFPEVYEENICSQDHDAVHTRRSEQLFNERAEGLEMRYNERNVDNHGHYRVSSVLPPDVKKRDTTLGSVSDRTRLESNECSYGDPPVYQLDGRSGLVQVKQQDRGLRGKLVPQDPQLAERFDALNVSHKAGNTSRLQGLQQEGKSTGQQLPENIERPKLKLFPRSQPLESSESRVLDSSKAQQFPSHDTCNPENVNEINANHQTLKLPGSRDGDNRPIERPRLNLKPRTQPLEPSTAIIERERKTIFGDALPREMVLKERGCDSLPDDLDMSLPDHRGNKNESIKMDMKTEIAAIPNLYERTESYTRVARDLERKDNRTDRGKIESQRSSWKSDNKYNTKEGVKQVERRPEPDSWRKPISEEPNANTYNPRNGKTASAFELTQIYSRSASETRSDNDLLKQSSLIGPNQVLFSRLVDNHREFKSRPNSRKINGY